MMDLNIISCFSYVDLETKKKKNNTKIQMFRLNRLGIWQTSVLVYSGKFLWIHSNCRLFLKMEHFEIPLPPKLDSSRVTYDKLVFLPTRIIITKSIWDITSHRSNLFTKGSPGPIRSGDQRETKVETKFGTETDCFTSIITDKKKSFRKEQTIQTVSARLNDETWKAVSAGFQKEKKEEKSLPSVLKVLRDKT